MLFIMNDIVGTGGGLNLMTCGSHPVFLPLNEVPHETLQATFLLKLQPAIPAVQPFVNKLSQITGGGTFNFFCVFLWHGLQKISGLQHLKIIRLHLVLSSDI